MLNGLPRRTAIVLACVLAACATEPSAASADRNGEACVPQGDSHPLKVLPEASGVALSRRSPGVLWSHNDSGKPVVVALSTAGAVQGRVQIANATVQDWEDVSVGACPGGACLFIADIGDNNAARRSITIYRVPEPQPGDAMSAAPETFTLRYPGGAHDAEAVFVAPGGEIFLITKDATTTLYRVPGTPRAGSEVTLERVADLPLKRVTDAETSADGAWVAVRTNDEVAFYRTADLVRGKAEGTTVSLRPLKEPQGEGVALAADGTLYLTSEGGGGGRLTAMRCSLK